MNAKSADWSVELNLDNLLLSACMETPATSADDASARSEKFCNPNAKGVLYRPANRAALEARAAAAGARFSEVFSIK